MRSLALKSVFVAAGVLLTSSALGRAVTDVEGNWSGPVVTKVAVRGVGANRAASTDDVQVGAGTWSAQNSRGWQYTGTWAPSGKKLVWSFTGGSVGELEDMLDDWAASFGFGSADTSVTSVTTNAKGTESNRKGRKLAITAKLKFTATLKGKRRNGRAKVKGRYTPQ